MFDDKQERSERKERLEARALWFAKGTGQAFAFVEWAEDKDGKSLIDPKPNEAPMTTLKDMSRTLWEINIREVGERRTGLKIWVVVCYPSGDVWAGRYDPGQEEKTLAEKLNDLI